MKLLNVELNTHSTSRSYPIIVSDSFQNLGDFIKKNENKCLIITDRNLEKLHLKSLHTAIQGLYKEVYVYSVPAGEDSKSLEQSKEIYEFLIQGEFCRDDAIIAFGGGVVGDLSGFVAATFMRGIQYIQVPTSLLAQVDSSVGGKTAVNVLKTKNVVGAFYQPQLVYINFTLLQTLPIEELRNGLVEVLVHAIIKDYDLFEYLEVNLDRILQLEPEVLEHLIIRNCTIKKEVVQRDERDKGERAILNFGHTYGHAIESVYDYKYKHGECVAIGIMGACYLAEQILKLDSSIRLRIRAVLERIQVFHSIQDCDKRQVLQFLSHDKKIVRDKVYFILPLKIGEVMKCEITDMQLVEEVLDTIIQES